MSKEKENTKPETLKEDASENIQELVNNKKEAPETEKKEAPETKKKSKKTKGHEDKKDEKIRELEDELKTLEDKYLRLYSDFDNYRKRTIKERIELGKTASAEIIGSLLSVLDDFERAQKAMKEAEDINAVKEGVELIYNKLSDILKKKGLEEINCIGETFNTDYHEAITNIPVDSEDLKGKIIDQTEKGYMLNGTILRYAKVVVGI